MDWLFDHRTQCWSCQTTMPVRNYIDLVRAAHASRGGINGQRDVLKTTTAKRIRDRMISDIRAGAVLPPVVLGLVVAEREFAKFPLKGKSSSGLVAAGGSESLSIIDGMQRTAALIEAIEIDKTVLDQSIRVEFWLARRFQSLVYRMLVLNTGQVPWTLTRQLAVVYKPLLEEIRERVPKIENIFSPDKPGRRVGAGQFGAEALVELYIAFSLRKTSVDTKEALSEEFSRLDFVENLSSQDFQDHFYETLSLLTGLDVVFEKFDTGTGEKFSKGRNIFDGQPARIGFVVAIAQYVLGRPGLDRSATERKTRMKAVQKGANALIKKLEKYTPAKVGNFLKLDVLAEVLDRKTGQVGRFERVVFFEAFKVLVDEEFELASMEPCWRAN